MASQISHVIYAQRYFEQLEKGNVESSGKIKKDEFILGCVFPDIRIIDVNLKRKDTHLRFEPLNLDFRGLTSFEAGWKFHLLCDMKREEILNKYNFYDIPNTTDLYNRPAKLVEDEVIYGYYDNWEKLQYYFNNPPFPEVGLNIDEETFKLWYAIVSKYIERKPDEKSMRIFLVKQQKVFKDVDAIISSIQKLRQNKKAIEILAKVWEEIL